jgi:hypothetical protein
VSIYLEVADWLLAVKGKRKIRNNRKSDIETLKAFYCNLIQINCDA